MCMSSLTLKGGDVVPCGKCPECRKRKISGWSFRLTQQDKVSMSSYFLTLTYDTSTVPISQSGFMSLVKRDLQLFFKRLRKAHTAGLSDGHCVVRPIKYYAVGEYGGKSFRPHYHVILFNSELELMFSKKDLLAWNLIAQDDVKAKGSCIMKCLQWPHGHATVGTVTGASVGYTLKYVCKPKRIPLHRNDDRVPEFSLMSKGLGVNYLSDAIFKWHHDDLEERMYLMLEDGRKIGMPRYYKDKLYDTTERFILARTMEKIMVELYEENAKVFDDPVKHMLAKRESTLVEYRKMYADTEKGRRNL